MPDTNPSPKLVTLTMGAVVLLCQWIASTEWTSSPKEKIAAGRLKGGKLEDLMLTQPDPCLLHPRDPRFPAAQYTAGKAMREWERKAGTIELSDLERQACAACVKFNANKAGGADEHLAVLQEQFGITE